MLVPLYHIKHGKIVLVSMIWHMFIRHPCCYIKCKYHEENQDKLHVYIKGWVLVILLDWAKFPKELCQSGSMYSTHAYTLTLDSVCFTPTPLAHTLDCSAVENVFLISGPSLSFHFFLPFLPICKHLKASNSCWVQMEYLSCSILRLFVLFSGLLFIQIESFCLFLFVFLSVWCTRLKLAQC